MALVKFDGLKPGTGGIWIDLERVVAIIPLFGTRPRTDTPNVVDLDVVAIGSRVAVGRFLVDLAVEPDEMAEEVANARGLELEDLSGLQHVSGAH